MARDAFFDIPEEFLENPPSLHMSPKALFHYLIAYSFAMRLLEEHDPNTAEEKKLELIAKIFVTHAGINTMDNSLTLQELYEFQEKYMKDSLEKMTNKT